MMNNQQQARYEGMRDVNQGISSLTLEEFNQQFSNVTINSIDGDIIYIQGEIIGESVRHGNRVHNKGVFITDKEIDEAVISILMASAQRIDKLPAPILLAEIRNVEQVKENYWRVELCDNQPRSQNNVVIVRFEPAPAVEGKVNKTNEDQVADAIELAAKKVKEQIINNMTRYRRAMEFAELRIGRANGVEENTTEYTFDNGIVVTECVTIAKEFNGIGIMRVVERQNDPRFKHTFGDELSFYHFIGKHI
jgi:hypothetical protein